ncbi:MAG: four helix bundle protein [Candidatus Magasanikbacteria bacterium]
MEGKFHVLLKNKINRFVLYCYQIVKNFPSNELYGVSSQLRRASMSIMLNYVEGYARRRDKVKLNFYEISHGSSQECKYIIYFAFIQNWISKDEYNVGLEMSNEIGKMIWVTIDKLEEKIESVS